jgi:hypothetical protein
VNVVASGDPTTSVISNTSTAYTPVSFTVNRAVFSVKVIPLDTFIVPPVDPVNASNVTDADVVLVTRV